MDEDHKTSFKTKTTSDSFYRFSLFPMPIITQCKKVTLEAKQEKTGKSEERNKGMEKRKDYIEKYENMSLKVGKENTKFLKGKGEKYEKKNISKPPVRVLVRKLYET